MTIRTWLKFSVVWLLAAIVVILAGALVPSLNQQVPTIKTEIINSLSVSGLNPNPLTTIKGDSAYEILNFLLSYGSFQGIFSLNGLSMFKFWVIDLYIFLPIITVFAVGTAIFVLVLLTNATAAHWKWNVRLLAGKWSTYIGGTLAYLGLFLGLILVAAADSSNLVNSQKKLWYNLDSGSVIVTWTNNVKYQPNVFSIMGLIINQQNLNVFFQQASGVLKTGAVFLIFIVPIAASLFIIGLAIRIAIGLLLPSSSSHRAGLGGSLLQWLGYINISSRRELRERLVSNIGMILLMIGFIVVMIFPAFTSTTHYVKENWIILSIAIVLMVVSFIPMYFMLFCLTRLQKFSYNLVMFIQMLTWLVIGVIWQILMWTQFKQFFQYPAFVPVIMIFFFANILLISFYLLIHEYRK